MNKIYKLKYCIKTGAYIAVSEMAKGKTKTGGKLSKIGMAVAAIATYSFSTTTIAAADLPVSYYNLSGTQTITVGDTYKNGTDGAIRLKNGATVTIEGENGESKISFTPNEGRLVTKPVKWNAFAVTAADATASGVRTLIAKDDFSIVINPHHLDTEGGGRHGVGAIWNSDFTFEKNLNVNIENIKTSSSEHYGLMAGSGNDFPDQLGIDYYNKITVKGDLNVAMSTENKNASMTMAGIRSIGGPRYKSRGILQDNNSSGAVKIDGKATINMTGAYAEGIYVSGGNSYVTLHDSDITMNNGWFGSAALKIGKSRDIASENKGRYSFGAGKGEITSTGAMNIDTTNSDGVAIQIQETKSKLIANGLEASSNIRSKVGALTMGAKDWTTHNNSTGIEVKVRNADWEVTNANSDLIKVSHGQKSAKLEFSGEHTDLKASSNGYILAVDGKDSELEFNATDAGKMTGLVSKETNNFKASSSLKNSVLNINLDNKFIWNLNAKDTTKTAVLDNLNLNNNAVLNGAYGASNNDYTVKAVLADGSKGTVTSKTGIINLTNETPSATDKLTINGNYIGENGKLKLDTVLGGDSSNTDLLVVTGNTSGITKIAITNVNGTGALTEKGIKVVRGDGDSAAGSFSLIGDGVTSADSITVGEANKHKFAYRLYQGLTNHAATGNNGIPSGTDTTYIDTNDWYLRSTCSGSHSVGTAFTASGYDGLGCTTDDVITVTRGADIAKVEGAGGADTIVINENAKVNGNVYGGNGGIDGSGDEDGADRITVTDNAVINGDMEGQKGNDSLTVSGNAVVTGVLNGGEGDDSFVWEDSSSIGGLNGGSGSDTATVSSNKYNGSQRLDGGAETDTLNFNGITAAVNGSQIVNWETVKLNNTDLTLERSLTTASGLDLNGNAMGLHIAPNSVLGTETAATVTGDVYNQGTLDLTKNSTPTQILTVNGDYKADNGLLKINTVWNAPGGINGEYSESDKLAINGRAEGSTKVMAVKTDGSPNIIEGNIQQAATLLNSVPVITVSQSGDIAFTGEATTDSAAQAQLAKRTVNGADEYYWTIQAKSNTDIYDPVVSGYALAGKTGLEFGYTTLGTLHERRGENQILTWDQCSHCDEQSHSQSWGRILTKNVESLGKIRLGVKHSLFGFQLGHDFAVSHTEDGGHRLTGGYISYGKMHSKYNDRYRAFNGLVSDNKYTGNGKQTGWYLGLTHTRYAANGAYLDLVGQIGFLQNKFNSRNNVAATQKGIGLALSAEAGRPYLLGEYPLSQGRWLIEPQAQLVYQALKLKDFNDGIKQVYGDTHQGLRGRLGLRLAYNIQAAEDKLRTHTVYLIANVLQDFKKGEAVNIGQDSIKETDAKKWAEIGLGGQFPVGKRSYLYADIRYERNIEGAKREGYRSTVGYKYTWK